MATPLLDHTDVEALSGETYADAALAQVNKLIVIASAKIRNKVSDIDDRIASGALDPDLVKGVGAEIVLRAYSLISRGIGVRRTEYPEWSTEYEPASDSGRPLVYVSDADVAELIDTPETGDAFTIMPGPR
jgi:hypothetical protein